MFGRRKQIDAKLAEMHDRLDRNSRLIEEDHHALVDLKLQIASVVEENKALRRRIDALEGGNSSEEFPPCPKCESEDHWNGGDGPCVRL